MATEVVEVAATAAVVVEVAMVVVAAVVAVAVEVDGAVAVAEVLAGSQSQPPSDAAEEIYWSPPPYGR